MKKFLAALSLICLLSMNSTSVFALENTNKITKGKTTAKTIIGGALSLLVWPGIGQAMNNNKGEKVLTHAIIGILPPYRFWSCYDAVVDRKGGYWEGKI